MRAALRVAAARVRGLLERTAFCAARDRARGPRRRAEARACRLRAPREAARCPSRRSAARTARERVVDGTRRDTLEQIDELREIVSGVAGDIPSVVAVNKADLVEQWQLTEADEESVGARGLHRFRTSAKTGSGVEDTFQWLAEATLASAER